MTLALYTPDNDRELVIELCGLLLRLTGGRGEDRALGADIVEAIGVSSLAGDPTSSVDAAMRLVDHARLNRMATIATATRRINDRVRGGWKHLAAVNGSDFAREIAVIVLQTMIAKLERAPA